MNYWLAKTEPYMFSWEQLVKDGTCCWDGVRNYTARNNLQAMKKGDYVLIYHSNEGLCIKGIAKVSKEAYADPTADDPRWVAVSMEPFKAFKKPVTLSQIKADYDFQNMQLVRQGRLSVSSVTPDEYKKILAMSK